MKLTRGRDDGSPLLNYPIPGTPTAHEQHKQAAVGAAQTTCLPTNVLGRNNVRNINQS